MAKVIEVIEVTTSRGRGTETDPARGVIEYWTKEGKLLAEYDSLFHVDQMRGKLAEMEAAVSNAKAQGEEATRRLAELESFVSDLEGPVRWILTERAQHKDREGWTTENDDRHVNGELAMAAACYAAPFAIFARVGARFKTFWPWGKMWDKRKQHTEVRRLVIAGSLIVAELERLLRKGVKHQ